MPAAKSALSVDMFLRDMLYVSYLLPAELVRPIVPASLALATIDNQVFVSLVIFRGKTSALARVPSPRFPFDQVNVRTYVLDPVTGGPSVYFVRCGISSGLITFLYRLLSGMPVEQIDYRITVQQDQEGTYTGYSATGNWNGEFSLMVRETAPALESLPPFRGVQEAVDYLIDPLVGFYGSAQRMRRLEVFHPPLVPRVGIMERARFPYLSLLGLLDPDDVSRPHNVLLIPKTPFHIYLPAQRYRP
jgi:hypothetical protein